MLNKQLILCVTRSFTESDMKATKNNFYKKNIQSFGKHKKRRMQNKQSNYKENNQGNKINFFFNITNHLILLNL